MRIVKQHKVSRFHPINDRPKKISLPAGDLKTRMSHGSGRTGNSISDEIRRKLYKKYNQSKVI